MILNLYHFFLKIFHFSPLLYGAKNFIFTSKSPRRLQLLKEICKELDIVVRKFDEKNLKGMQDIEEIKNRETPTKYVTRVAMDSNIFHEQLIKQLKNKPIICGDNSMSRDKIFKARSKSNVIETLTQLSNQQHEVITSIVLSTQILNKIIHLYFIK